MAQVGDPFSFGNLSEALFFPFSTDLPEVSLAILQR
jgi:hypothetical protein